MFVQLADWYFNVLLHCSAVTWEEIKKLSVTPANDKENEDLRRQSNKELRRAAKQRGAGPLTTPASASRSSPGILHQRLHPHSLVARWKCGFQLY